MLKKDRYHHILSWFEANQPEVQTELRYGSPFQLLVAVILSAQCTDRRVNMVTPELFRRFPAPEDLAGAPVEDVLAVIKSVSYPNSKAAHLVGMAGRLVADFGGEVPSDIDSVARSRAENGQCACLGDLRQAGDRRGHPRVQGISQDGAL